MARLQDSLATQDGLTVYMQPVQDLTIEDRVSRTQYQMTLSNPDLGVLSLWTPKLVERLRHVPGLSDVTDDLQDEGLQTWVEIDRDAASRLGITAAVVDEALYDAFGQRLISTIFTQSNQYRVVLEAQPQFQTNPAALGQIHVPTSTGGQVPLSSVARITEGKTVLAVNRLDQFPMVTVSFNGAGRLAIRRRRGHQGRRGRDRHAGRRGDALPGRGAGLPEFTDEHAVADPGGGGHHVHRAGRAVRELHPPHHHPVDLALGRRGALLALLISGTELDMIGIIGIILLIGIVKKNAIMMIDFALDAERKRDLSPRAAIHEAALLRFRPILMTTLAALFGALPLMLSTGTGAELRQPLGIVMVGGLLLSQVLTLFTTPVIYLMFDRLSRRWRGARPARPRGAS